MVSWKKETSYPPSRLAGLKPPWPKGVSGNPSGKRKETLVDAQGNPIEPTPKPKPQAKPKYAPSNIERKIPPGASADFLTKKQTDARDAELAKMQEAARKDPARYPGGQLSMAEIAARFPDPRPTMEIIRFTRVPGGKGIRRC